MSQQGLSAIDDELLRLADRKALIEVYVRLPATAAAATRTRMERNINRLRAIGCIVRTAEILERYLPSLVLLNDYGTGVGVSVEEAIVPIAHLIDNPPHAALSAFIKTKPVDLTMNTFDRGKAVRLDDITKSC